ncbi:hypothetical protein N9112_00245 [bacterium]|nr:hypothetical protein [bacterium]
MFRTTKPLMAERLYVDDICKMDTPLYLSLEGVAYHLVCAISDLSIISATEEEPDGLTGNPYDYLISSSKVKHLPDQSQLVFGKGMVGSSVENLVVLMKGKSSALFLPHWRVNVLQG